MKERVFVNIVIIMVLSCNKPTVENNKIVAKVNGTEIYLSDADNFVKYEIYEALQRIHVLRKAAIDELVNERLMELEAKRLGLTKEEFIEKEINNKTSDFSVNAFIKEHKLDSIGIPDISNGYKIIFPDSKEGKLIAREEYRKQIKMSLLENLKEKYPIQILLDPQLPLKWTQKNFYTVHYKGNEDSKTTLIIISDFACENCQAAFPLFEKIFDKYKNKIKFGFTHFSPNVTLASISAEAANNQNKFWEYHDEIFKVRKLNLSDTASFINIAKKLNLNINQFKLDISSNVIKEKIQKNIDLLKSRKIYATPTLIVNDKVILDAFDENKIEKILNDELQK